MVVKLEGRIALDVATEKLGTQARGVRADASRTQEAARSMAVQHRSNVS